MPRVELLNLIVFGKKDGLLLSGRLQLKVMILQILVHPGPGVKTAMCRDQFQLQVEQGGKIQRLSSCDYLQWSSLREKIYDLIHVNSATRSEATAQK